MAKKAKRRILRPSPRDPHGCAPDSSETVLLLIDVINDFNFPTAAKLLRHALPAARRIAALKKRLSESGIPAVYVNDNFGRWRSDFRSQVQRCLTEGGGAEVSRLLMPGENDYFVLKPKHSGFYCTSLEVLLHYLGAKRLILTGFTADICVLYTAHDAYMRDYQLFVPSDCVACETAEANRLACAHLKRFLKADIRPSRLIRC
jgi:nicotinamidase-related amidase